MMYVFGSTPTTPAARMWACRAGRPTSMTVRVPSVERRPVHSMRRSPLTCVLDCRTPKLWSEMEMRSSVPPATPGAST
eukprot:4230129-Lingulodinium_polyedra.AAC.1